VCAFSTGAQNSLGTSATTRKHRDPDMGTHI
jgi:hypothetical protein